MAYKREYKTLSRRARRLLSMSEGVEVEFKEALSGLEAGDLVAFANSEKGGAILIGVREAKDEKGRQYGEILGCEIGDKAKLKIVNKALSCVPPVQIDIFVENLNDTPFYRIEIPSSTLKPHCTSGGVYKIRSDGRVQPLYPDAILEMFLEREASEFQKRFLEATGELEAALQLALQSVQEIKVLIDEKLNEIGSTLEWAEYRVDDTASTIERVERVTSVIKSEISSLQRRAVALLEATGGEDPLKEEARELIRKAIEKAIQSDEILKSRICQKKRVSLSIESPLLKYFSQEELNELFTEICQKFREQTRESNA